LRVDKFQKDMEARIRPANDKLKNVQMQIQVLQESQEADGPVVLGEKPVSVSQEDLQEVVAMGA